MTISFKEFPDERSAIKAVPVLQENLVVSPAKPGIYRNLGKRVLDVAAILMAAPIVVPVVAALALTVALDGGKPFYTQQRIGLHGRRFRMWKLRSMVVDADIRMAEHLEQHPAAKAEWDVTQKLKNDPRITKFGRILRRSSLDELPQLWNVLIGDMSLVGPRPMMTNQQTLYKGTAYYCLRPGITGYWQTAGRNATTFEARAEFDAAYDAELSLQTDAKVLVRTVGVVLKATGY